MPFENIYHSDQQDHGIWWKHFFIFYRDKNFLKNMHIS